MNVTVVHLPDPLKSMCLHSWGWVPFRDSDEALDFACAMERTGEKVALRDRPDDRGGVWWIVESVTREVR